MHFADILSFFIKAKQCECSSAPSNGRQTFERYCEQDGKSKFATISGRFSISAAEDSDATKNNLHFHGFIYVHILCTLPDIAMKLDSVDENVIFRSM